MTTTVTFSSLRTRSSSAWMYGTLAMLLGIAAFAGITMPEARPWVPFAPLLVLVALIWMRRSRQQLETAGGQTVLVERRLLRTSRASVTGARELALRGNGAGAVQLVVRDQAGTASAPLLLLNPYAEVAQPDQVLDAVLEAVRSSRGRGATDVADTLAAQLQHQKNGAAPAGSPLAPMAAIGLPGAAARGRPSGRTPD